MIAGRLAATLVFALGFLSTTQTQGPRTYSTSFTNTETPISEGGRWINGHRDGFDWHNVDTRSGLAYGGDRSGHPRFNDPTAVLAGEWGPNQTVHAKVRTMNQQGGRVYQEVEIRLRTSVSPHWNAGYEINFRCTHDAAQYVEIVRWNGRLGDFTYLTEAKGPGLRDGDVVSATMIGSVITAFINGTQVAQATDTTFADGSPGMGFYLDGKEGVNGDYGFTFFQASDGAIPWPPSKLRVTPLTR